MNLLPQQLQLLQVLASVALRASSFHFQASRKAEERAELRKELRERRREHTASQSHTRRGGGGILFLERKPGRVFARSNFSNSSGLSFKRRMMDLTCSFDGSA